MRSLSSLLSLPILPAETTAASTSALFRQSPYVILRGAVGSGRSLVLLQLAHQWATTSQPAPLLYLSLARADKVNMPPDAVFRHAFHDTGLPSPLEHSNGSGSPLSWLLLLDDWELLPTARRAEWQTFLLSLPTLCPEAQVALALPESSAEWTGYQTIRLEPPDEQRLQTWLAYMLPQHDPEPLLAALQPGELLAPLRQRLLDVALLALTYPTSGLPASRAQLYEWAYAQDQQQMSTNQQAGFGAGMWGIATARTLPVPGSWLPDDQEGQRMFHIGSLPLHCYEMAHALAAAENVQPVSELEDATRAEVALLLSGMLPDPAPLYAVLWPQEQPVPAPLLTLARCVCERPTAAPEWGARVMEALLEQSATPAYDAITTALAPALPAMLVAAGTAIADERAAFLLGAYATAAGDEPLLALVNHTGVRPALRWSAADALLRLPTSAMQDTLLAAQPSDTLTKAIYCYLLVRADAGRCASMPEPVALDWIHAMQDERVSHERRSQVVSALLNDARTPATLRAPVLALMPHISEQSDQGARDVLLQSCVDGMAAVRQAALGALRSLPPQEALHMFSSVLLDPSHIPAVYRDALEHLPHYAQGEASALLVRCALAHHMPLALRLRALVLLSKRQQAGAILLRRLLRVETVHPLVRVAAVRLLAHHGATGALDDICHLVTSAAPLLVRQAAIDALGTLGQHSAQAGKALASLVVIVKHDPGHSALTRHVVQTLGRLGVAQGVSVLGALLQADVASYVRAWWLAAFPEMCSLPVAQWYEAELSAEMHVILQTLLNDGETDADQPGSFEEFVERQALDIRMAAALALAEIAHRVEPAAQQRIRALLLHQVQQRTPGQEVQHMLMCLAQASHDGGVSDLGQLLSRPTLDPALRWLIVEQLGQNPDAEPVLLRCLEHGLLDTFTRSKLAHTLGRLGAFSALPTLRQMAEQRDGDVYLRSQAIEALGLFADPAIETTLLHIVADVTTTPALRGAAADALPDSLRPEMRRWLYELLRRERQPPELITGVLRALGRTKDREALGLMLRYTQSDVPMIAMTAMNVLVDLGDASVAPNLIRVTQNTKIDQSVRLHAVTVLLKLCGTEYLPLLRGYLESNVLSLQLPALECLLAVRPDEPLPLLLVTHKTTPMALRLRAIEALAQRHQEHGVLGGLLLDASDDLHLRLAAASILAQSTSPEAVGALARCAREQHAPLRLRRRVIMGLFSQASKQQAAAAEQALAQLAEDAAQPGEIRAWAADNLLRLLLPDTISNK